MKELRLVEHIDGEKEVWKDPRPHLIKLFNMKYEEVTGEKNPFPFGACMKAMLHFEITDHKTGELYIEYPEEDIWVNQVDGFFQDRFAKDKRSFHFTYLLKQFGSFHKPKQKEKTINKRPIIVLCDNCGKTRPATGICQHCGC